MSHALTTSVRCAPIFASWRPRTLAGALSAALLTTPFAAHAQTGSRLSPAEAAPARDLIARSEISPLRSLVLPTPAIDTGPGRSTLSTGGTETAGGAPIFINDDFSSYTLTDFTAASCGNCTPISGQINPFGKVVTPFRPWVGVATDAIMLAGGGVPPGAAPAGGEPYLALARRTGGDPRFTSFGLAMTYPFPAISAGLGTTPGDHARITTDWFLLDDSTFYGSSAVSIVNGLIIDRVFFGGTDFPASSELNFALGASNTLDTFVTVGFCPSGCAPGVGDLYATPRNALFPFPVNQWFSIMSIVVQNPVGPSGLFGSGVFIKSADTIANGILDPRMASGAIIPLDKIPAGWLCIYPGIADDPSTPTVIEGIGLAKNAAGANAPTTGALALSPLLTFPVVDGLQVLSGLDPDAATHPSFVPQDAFIDNKPVAGRLLCPADLNGDRSVDGADISFILNVFGSGAGPADLNGDGTVNGGDISFILNVFGPCPPM